MLLRGRGLLRLSSSTFCSETSRQLFNFFSIFSLRATYFTFGHLFVFWATSTHSCKVGAAFKNQKQLQPILTKPEQPSKFVKIQRMFSEHFLSFRKIVEGWKGVSVKYQRSFELVSTPFGSSSMKILKTHQQTGRCWIRATFANGSTFRKSFVKLSIFHRRLIYTRKT